MTTRLLTGRRRYAELEPTVSAAESGAYMNQASEPTVPFSSSTTNPVIAPNVGGATTPFGHSNPTNPVNPFASSNPVHRGLESASNNLAAPTLTNQMRRKSSKARGAIDTDQIPRPEVNPEQTHAPAEFVTNQFINYPPASFTNFMTVDNGNAGPRFIRSSFYKVPTDDSLLTSTHIPLGMIIQPFADPVYGEEPVQMVDYGEKGPFRCTRCRTYINPNWIFIQGGNTAVCNLCKTQIPVPKELYCPLDTDGRRTDVYERPELSKGVYEFLAPASYHTRKAVTSNLIFCIEASTACYMTGIFHQVMSSIQSLLDYIPCPELTKVCIITYDTGINFFKVPEDLSKELSVVHVPEIDESYLPFPKQALFLSLHEEKDKINYLIERIIKHYESNNRLQKGVTASCFGTALVNSCELLSQDGGRVLMFATQAPVAGLGKIKRRDDYKLYGTDKERTLYVPQVEEYAEWAKNWLSKRVAVDLFSFAPEYFDLTTIGQVCNVTGGNIYHYPTYNGTYDGERVHYDLSRNLTRTIAYDAVMTTRFSQGISFLDYVLPSGRRVVPEVEFSAIDADATINIYLRHEDKLKDETVGLQVAILYTNIWGQKIVRVINFTLGTSNDLSTIFKSCDVEAVSQLIIKKNILNVSSISIAKVRKDLLDNLVAIFHSYRTQCATSLPATQLVFPDQLRFLPVFFLAVFKAGILRTLGDIKPDDRSFDLHRFIKMPLNVLSNLWYVKVYALHTIYEDNEYGPGNVVEERVVMGNNMASTDEKLESHGIYLLDNNDTIYIYVKKNADPQLIQELFGVDSFQEVIGLTSFPEQVESYYFTKVFNMIDQLRKSKNASYQPVKIVTEKDAFEPALLNLLVEDERLGESYNTFLCNVHKLIQGKM